ncbi:MAG: ferritin-like domain-containing protein [Nocardioidaceae bacterium]
MTTPDSAVDALQTCLAAEHAAVYGYGVLGGALATTGAGTESADYARADASYTVHRGRRDHLAKMLRNAGKSPVPAEAAYDIPFPATDKSSSRRLARHLERRCAGVYARAVASTVDDTRRFVANALTDAAVRDMKWGGKPQAFPGLQR